MDHEQFLEYLKPLVLSAIDPDGRIVARQLYARGSNTYNYRVSLKKSSGTIIHVIVRVPMRDTPRQRAELAAEHWALRLLEENGFTAAPRSYLYDASLTSIALPFSIQSYIPATPVRELMRPAIHELGALLASLHNIEFTDACGEAVPPILDTPGEFILREVCHLRDWIERVLGSMQAWPCHPAIERILMNAWHIVEKLLIEAQGQLAGADACRSLTHGDVGLHNLGTTGARLVLFDWQLSAPGDPAFDLAKLFMHDIRHESARRQFMASYRSGMRRRAHELLEERVQLYEPVVALQSATWAIRVMFETRAASRSAVPPEAAAQATTLRDVLIRNLAILEPALANRMAEILDRSASSA